MKKTLLFASLFLCIIAAKAQDSQGGTPYSFNHNELTTAIDLVQVAAPDIKQLTTEDAERASKSAPYRIGVTLPVNLDINNSGTWTELPGLNASLWQLTVRSQGARAIGFGYNQFYMPEGAKLYLYNKTKSMVIGAYTSVNNTENMYFSNEKVSGDEITFELLVPNAKKNAVLLNITELNYFYRGGETEYFAAASDACEVNINCTPEGTNWQNQKKGVCKLDIRVGANWYNCSGSLVNNTNQNCTPYVLLADHCHYDAGYASTADYNAWIFYFHYEASTCTGTTSSTTKTKSGCSLKAHDTYGSNNAGSDFCLVQINSAIVASFNVYYNGWDRNNTASASGVSIHHPAGDIMKISTYTSALTSLSVGGSGTHWQVYWAATTNGHGVTEGGSSGSPIFNAAGKIVGTLTGGSSYCTATGSPDYYGKFYYHWDKNGSTNATQLKPWLDPANSGVTSLAGTATCSIGVAENNYKEEKAGIYPSPAHDEINLEILTNENVVENVSIYNLMGVVVKNIASLLLENGKAAINIADLSDGFYFLTATKDNITFKGEFVKIK
ncbi:MAG: T9SS type A sorting domain-containing protein [Bacteroidota bacterium]